MTNFSAPAAHRQKHQNPLIYIGVFLVIAIGALVLITAVRPDGDTGSGETPGPANAMDCLRGTPDGFTLSDVEGKTTDELESWAAGKDMTVRVTMEDGQSFPQTMDYRPDRVNVQVEAGVVTRYCGNF
ncbi:MAG: hypothetical protein QM648_07660 [Solirubrobacterales bacterium]